MVKLIESQGWRRVSQEQWLRIILSLDATATEHRIEHVFYVVHKNGDEPVAAALTPQPRGKTLYFLPLDLVPCAA